MRIQILSDIHTEFHNDSGEQFITAYLRPKGVDVLIIAGDIGVGDSLFYSLQRISEHYKNTAVLYVPGNHDFYHSNFAKILHKLSILENAIDNLFVLNNRMKVIGGIDFVGAPLWFKRKKNYKKHAPDISDFEVIKGFEDRVFKENKKSLKFLDWHVSGRSIVITHHQPTFKSTPMEYRTVPSNIFYYCNMEKLIKERKPLMWVHGHTHGSFNYILGKTHVVCNPLGYVGRQVNAEFIPNMMIDV